MGIGDPDCICEGNWRDIVAENEQMIGEVFKNEKGESYVFFGIVHGLDDYYYGMVRKGGDLRLLSCVGSLAGHGYHRV